MIFRNLFNIKVGSLINRDFSRGGNSVFVRGVGYFKNKGSNRGLPGSQQCVCSICVPGPDSCVPGQINQSDFFLEFFIQ